MTDDTEAKTTEEPKVEEEKESGEAEDANKEESADDEADDVPTTPQDSTTEENGKASAAISDEKEEPAPAEEQQEPSKDVEEEEENGDGVDGLSDKVKSMFVKKESDLVEPAAFAEAFHGSGSVNYTPDAEAPPTPTPATKGKDDGEVAEDPTADALPSTPSSSFAHTDETRAASHAKLRAYEATRRASYATKLSSSRIYWQSVRDMCHDSIAETVRAEQTFKGFVHLNDGYATFLQASADNMLDDGGMPVLDARRRKKLEELRSPAGKAKKVLSGHENTHDDDAEKVGKEDSADAGENNSDTGGVLDSLFASQSAMSEKFVQFSKFIEEDAVPEIAKIKESLVMQVDIFEKLGDAIVDNMEAAEKEVADAWESYHEAAEKDEGFVRSKDRLRGVKMAETVTAGDEDFVKNCEDVWILEMKYRMAVAYLSACWNKSSAEMTKVFTALKREECGRRFRTRELLSVFLEKQDELWLSLPAISAPLMKDLQGKPRGPADIEAEVQDIIRNRAAIKQEEEEEAEGIAEKPGPGLDNVDQSQGDFDLQSPLLSDILVKVDLLEVKYAPYLMKQWRTVLAVVTANSFLHLFDLSSTTHSSAKEAFHALVPSVDIPTEDTVKTLNMAKHRKDWYKLLHPSDSFALANCAVAFKENDKGAYSFEITEKIQQSLMMGKTTSRKMQVRVSSKDKEKEWIAALKADKCEQDK